MRSAGRWAVGGNLTSGRSVVQCEHPLESLPSLRGTGRTDNPFLSMLNKRPAARSAALPPLQRRSLPMFLAGQTVPLSRRWLVACS